MATKKHQCENVVRLYEESIIEDVLDSEFQKEIVKKHMVVQEYIVREVDLYVDNSNPDLSMLRLRLEERESDRAYKIVHTLLIKGRGTIDCLCTDIGAKTKDDIKNSRLFGVTRNGFDTDIALLITSLKAVPYDYVA